jgi:2-polyprenyl-3-methyl-5-hydroxy-6-metoxy-1,4-benzoquinol methylase
MSDPLPRLEASDARRDAWNIWIEEKVKSDHPDNVRRGEAALRLLKSLNLANPSIVDIGCANGWFSAQLARFGKVVGVDLADRAIAEAKVRYPDVDFICGDFMTLGPRYGQFDVAVSVDVISHIGDQQLFLDKVADLLQPGGFLILVCGNKFVWNRTRYPRLPEVVPEQFLYKQELRKLISRRFVVQQCITIIPGGNVGMLRLINSRRIELAIGKIIPSDYLTSFKEKVGLGKSILVLAKKHN